MMKNEDGFTIQELLVVLIVGSLLVSFSLSLYLFTGRLISTWQKTTALRESVHRTLHIIALDIEKSQRIVEISDTTCSMVRQTGKVVTYRFNGLGVWRNDIPINSDTAIVMMVRIQRIPGMLQETPSGRRVRMTVKGILKTTEYSAEAGLLLPQSSVQKFYAAGEKSR
jgi:type II secretory pathway component PulJ